MTANTSKDREFKLGLLDDTLTVLDMEKLYIINYIVYWEIKNKLEGLISFAREKLAKIIKK